MNRLPTLILLLFLSSACSTNYPVLEPEAKVIKKMGNEVMFIFNEHQGKGAGYQWFRVDNPDEYTLGSTYYLSPKIGKKTME